MEKPKTARELYQTSQTLYHKGAYETSLEHIEKALVIDNSNLEYFQLRGMILSKLQLPEKALQDFDWVLQCIERTKLLVEDEKSLQGPALLGRIQIHFHQKNYALLLNESNALLALERNNWQAFFYRGVGHYFSQTYQQALEDLEMAFYLSNEKDKIRPYRALVYFKHSRYQLAQKDFEIALKQKPHDVVLWYNNGVNYYRLKMHDAALQSFDKALELGLKNTQLYTYKGKALQQLGRYTEAEKCLEQAQKKSFD